MPAAIKQDREAAKFADPKTLSAIRQDRPLKKDKKRYFKIECYSYGGETVIGNISKDQYKYWIAKEDAMAEYFSDIEFDFEKANKGIPEKSRFNCSWFELDDIIHTNGPNISNDNFFELIETDKDEIEIKREQFIMNIECLDQFNLDFKCFDPPHDKIKGKYFSIGKSYEKGTWSTMESGMGLIETDKNGINKEKLIFHNIEVYDEITCHMVSYNGKKYDLIGNTRTQSMEMNLYEK